VELIVVLAVFIVVIGSAVSIFISIVQHQKMIIRQQEFLNQISYVTEYMSRTIRMSVEDTTGNCIGPGYLYLLTHPDGTGFYEGIKFIANNGTCQEFFLDAEGVLKESKDGAPAQIILSDKFQVNYVRFIIDGNKNVDSSVMVNSVQSRITMLFNIDTQITGDQQTKVFQTTVSKRNLNIQP